MACWQWTSSDRRFHQRSWRDSYRGSDALLVMPGPSLAEAAPLLAAAARAGAVVIGANTSYPAVRPDVWIGGDHPECYDAGLMSQPFPKLLGNAYAERPWQGRRIKEFPATYFMDKEERADFDEPTNAFLPMRLGEQPGFVWGWTFFTALHLAAWMGCRRIYLVGVDMGGGKDAETRRRGDAERDPAARYHDGRVLDSHLAEINRTGMRIQLEWLGRLRDMGAKFGYELIVTGEHSAAREHLPFVPLTEALKRIARRAAGLPMIEPPTDGRVHGLLANQAQWSAKPKVVAGSREPVAGGEEFGVLTGSDQKTEWRLTWWYENLRRHYAGPVAFGDFGLSDAMRAWCRERGEVHDCRGTYLPGWFNKPVAMTRIPWRRAAWIDTDAEVVGDISDLAAMDLGDAGYAATPDPYNPWDVGLHPVNTGVVVFEHGCPAIRAWARAALTDPSRARGDQELLNRLRDDHMIGEPAELPAIFNSMRFAPWDGQERIIHWTGPDGNSWIRRLVITERGRAGVILGLLPENRPLRAAEVGVLDGRTSRILLQRRPMLGLYMVDRWAELPNEDGGLDKPVRGEHAELVMANALKVTAFAQDRRTVIRGDSATAAEGVPDESLDLVFIDADHSEAGCYRDVAAWASKVKPGGTICGHDIDHEEFPHWGVREAVLRWMSENEYEPADLTTGLDHTWFLTIRTRGEPRSRRDESCAEEPAAIAAAG